LLQSATLLSLRHRSRLQREPRQYSRSFSLPVSPAGAVAGVIRPRRKRGSLHHLKFQNVCTSLQVSPPVYTNLHVLPPTGRGVPSLSQVMDAEPEVDSSLSIQYAMQAMSGHRPAHTQVNVAPHVEPILKHKASLIRAHPHSQQLQRCAAQAPTGDGVEKKTGTSMERLRDVKVPPLSFPDSILGDRDHKAQAVVRLSDPDQVPHPQAAGV
jgi:hypothetical protein